MTWSLLDSNQKLLAFFESELLMITGLVNLPGVPKIVIFFTSVIPPLQICDGILRGQKISIS